METAAARRRRASSTASLTYDDAVALAAVILLAAFSTAAAATESSHKSHDVFGYEGSTGPENWANLNSSWTTCHNGKRQSPIDISKVEAHNYMGPLKLTYTARPAIMQNLGHDFVLKWRDGNGQLTLEGKEYMLQQVHWHVPSEHTVNGTRFDMEMHMVHEGASKARAVVSMLYSTKQPINGAFHHTLEPYFKRLAGRENADEAVEEPVDPTPWVDQASGYYTYHGSLTTPPCTEGVIWTIMSKVKHVSKEQIKELESVTKVLEHNVRPIQNLNGRVIRYYEPQTKVMVG